jgi:hypothetical protein
MGTKITNLPQVVNSQGTDELAISQDIGGGSRTTYKTTLDQVKNYVKNTGGGTGTVTSVSLSSPNGSINIFGSPIVGSGTITVEVSSVGLDKLDDGGATNGQVLTYNGSTSTWVASAVPKELPQTALSGQVLSYDGSTSTWVASAVPKELPQTALSGQILTYNGSTSTWVASSLSANGFNVSLSSNGYQKLPSGLIMQWGKTISTGADSTVSVSFPISFVSEVYSVVVTQNAGRQDGSSGTISVDGITITSFNIQNGADNTGPFYWQAIGY